MAAGSTWRLAPILTVLGFLAQGAATPPVSLSLLASDHGGLAWMRYWPETGARRQLARFPAAEGTAHLAFGPEKRRGAVFFSSEPPRLFEAELGSGRVRPLPAPPDGQLEDLGYDRDGRLVALTLETPEPQHDEQGDFLRYGGHRYALEPAEGMPALAHAFRLVDGAWRHAETAVTSTGWDYAMGVSALKVYGRLAPRSETLPGRAPEGDAVEDPALRKRLDALAPDLVEPEGQWITLRAAVPLYLYEANAEFVMPTNVLAYGAPLRRVPGLARPKGGAELYSPHGPAPWLTAVSTQGRYVLVTDVLEGAHPRLFDLKAQRMAYASDGDRLVTFWP